MIWWRDVYSTMVSEVGYDDETQELMIRWKNGRVSAYQGVDEGTALRLSKAPSVGTAVNGEIKNRFPHRYVV